MVEKWKFVGYILFEKMDKASISLAVPLRSNLLLQSKKNKPGTFFIYG